MTRGKEDMKHLGREDKQMQQLGRGGNKRDSRTNKDQGQEMEWQAQGRPQICRSQVSLCMLPQLITTFLCVGKNNL